MPCEAAGAAKRRDALTLLVLGVFAGAFGAIFMTVMLTGAEALPVGSSASSRRARLLARPHPGDSTSRSLGLGLPGSRRMMDEFKLVSEVGKGTEITMTKWERAR